MTIDLDLKIVFSALSFLLSLYSLWMAHSAKKEARQTALLEMVHQKRMLLSNQFSDIARIVRVLKDEKFEDERIKNSYEQLRDYRNRLIDAMNESSEMLVETSKLDKKLLLNEISDFNLMNAIYKSNIAELEEYIEVKSKANKPMQPTPSALAD